MNPAPVNKVCEEALALHRKGQTATALSLLDGALSQSPNAIGLLVLKGRLLQAARRFDEALAAFGQALIIAPDQAEVLNDHGALLSSMGRPDEGLAPLDRAQALMPDNPVILYNRGNALRALKRQAEALASYDRSVAAEPRLFQAWNNRGAILHDLKRHGEAVDSFDKALALSPGFIEAWNNRGNALSRLGRQREALESYDRAVALDANFASAWTQRGIVLRDLKRVPEALWSLDKALAAEPDRAETLNMRGMLRWVEMRDYDGAVRDLEQAVALDPDCPYALGSLLLVKQYGGDWRDFDAIVARIDAGVRAGKVVVEPFVYQAISRSPADLQACSIIHARELYPPAAPLVPKGPRRGGKIRLGYVSGEFRDQATAHLMAGLYESHDRSRFELFAFDNGFDDASAIRKRLAAAFDAFTDIARLSDQAAAEKITADGIDILINLNGYFGAHRMGVFAKRPAPVQVNYLGFPATLGAPYMDYLIADRMVIPEAERRFHSEQIVYLPDCYQANDTKRAIAPQSPSRADCGLPPDAFMFCNFNAGYKLTPSTFASWMRIMKAVPGSVLWLLEGDPNFTRNVRGHAQAQGVESGRIIMAPFQPSPAHLARLGLADLMLDSLPYNAHTTASDALWAGVPILTRQGTAFAGRVGASLLNAVGLPELVTQTQADYENLAVKLAEDKSLLKSLRDRLARNRSTAPLFDTGRFCKRIEAAYETMFDIRQQGEPAKSFGV